MPPLPPRPKSKVSGLYGIASGLGGAAPASLRGKVPKSQPPPPLRYVPGGVIGEKYRLTKVLGEGGMGAVWVARNLRLDVDVAIKLIRREVAAEDTSERLLQEARAAARIGHPSIVRVYDFGETEYKDPYIVMELLEGESLRQVLDRKARLPAVNAVQTVLPVVSALVAAHGKGIIHRDIKPENILLAEDERGVLVPKIVDFGIAKLRRDADENRKQTQAGSVVGSPDYMSPEQARGRADIDERSDVWSMCVVIYEVVTGTCPFVAENSPAQLRAISEEPPTPIADSVVGDDELWTILSRGLEKDKAARWPSMRALGGALAAWCLAKNVEADVSGALLSLEWAEAVVRRPLSEPPPSLAEARAATLSQRASSDPSRDDERVSSVPARSIPRVAWPSRAERETIAAEVPPPSARRGPPPLPKSPAKATREGPGGRARVGARRRCRSGRGEPSSAPAPSASRSRACRSPRGRRSRRRRRPIARASVREGRAPQRRRSRAGRWRCSPSRSPAWAGWSSCARRRSGRRSTSATASLRRRSRRRPSRRTRAHVVRDEPSRDECRRRAAGDVEPAPSSSGERVAVGLESAAPSASAESASASASGHARVPGRSPRACRRTSPTIRSTAAGRPLRLASLCSGGRSAQGRDRDEDRGRPGRRPSRDRSDARVGVTPVVRARRVRIDPRRLLSRARRRSSSRPSASAIRSTARSGTTGAAATSGGDVDGALARFKKAVSCVNISGASNNFTYPALAGGEETAFKKTLARVAKHH